MATVSCVDNPRLNLIGCGATYGGERQHSVARVSWSRHPDGRAHETFSTANLCDVCWQGSTMHDPRTVLRRDGNPALTQDSRGVWHRWSATPHPQAVERVLRRAQSDETTPEAP
jgi:hypothetical protein